MPKTTDVRGKQVLDTSHDDLVNIFEYYRSGTREKVAQDQYIFHFRGPKGNETHRTLQLSSGDPQSDALQKQAVVPELAEFWKILLPSFRSCSYSGPDILSEWRKRVFYTRIIEIEEAFTQDESTRENIEDALLNPNKLAEDILDSNLERDVIRLRELIFRAEDTGFDTEQSDRLGQWLLNFAMRYRDSSDSQDEAVVWSAIRTGASMLGAGAVDHLRPLLEPGHSIETSLVTLKMLGRIFEAQPPTEVDQHPNLAAEVSQIARDLLNRYVITVSQSAAMAHLAIYALAAMASSETEQIVEVVESLGVTWFTRRTLRKLRQLKDIWANRATPVAVGPRSLLNDALEKLEKVGSVSFRGLDAVS